MLFSPGRIGRCARGRRHTGDQASKLQIAGAISTHQNAHHCLSSPCPWIPSNDPYFPSLPSSFCSSPFCPSPTCAPRTLTLQEATINRLLRAQTGRSRNKIAKEDQGEAEDPSTSAPASAPGAPEGGVGAGGTGTDAGNADQGGAEGADGGYGGGGRRKRARMQPVQEGMIRWVSSLAPAPASASAVGGSDEAQSSKMGVVTGTTVLRLGIPQGLVNVLEFAR